MREHGAALDYDCMTRTGRTVREYEAAGPDGIVALAHLVRYLGPGSALWDEMHPGDTRGAWSGALATNAILADAYDLLAVLNANLVGAFSKGRARQPKPYPRPGARQDGGIGKGAIPVRDFDEWWESG